MKQKGSWRSIIVLAVFALLIHLFSLREDWVEKYYSTGVYPYFGVFFRSLLGWLPFSLGDILYGLVMAWLLFRLFKLIAILFSKKVHFTGLVPWLQRVTTFVLLIYIVFNLAWGINYNRQGIARQLGLPVQTYSVDELKTLNGLLLLKVNENKSLLLRHPPDTHDNAVIREEAGKAYDALNRQYTFLNYHPVSIKASLWGWLGNYLGFMGYYNPFTGEGQVNTTIPRFLQPYTSCHEIAHQLGYAKENEANFVGYLAAAASGEVSFHYSVYLDLYLYANRNLGETDSTAARSFSKQLLPAVKDDLNEWRRFSLSHQNPVEPVIRWIYGKYLENNQQPSGVLSYDEVTGFMIAYYKKFGRL